MSAQLDPRDDDPLYARAEADESTQEMFAPMLGDEMEDVAECFWTLCNEAIGSRKYEDALCVIKERARAVKSRAIELQVIRYDMGGEQ